MSVTIHDGNSLFIINYVTQILCFVLVTPLVLLRLFVRWKVIHKLGVDDACCFVGWLLFMGYCANGLIYGFAGGSYHSTELNSRQYEQCIKISYIATAIYAPTALFVKVSLITILIRVFQPYYKAMISLYILLGTVIGYYTIITFIKIFICNPVSAYWVESKQADATCLSQPGVIIADSVISFITDVAIFAFPVAFTWTLQMPLWKKVKVMVLLGFGGIAVAFSLFRLVVGIHEKDQPRETTMFMTSILTANAEVGFGLICACLPAINVLLSWTRRNSSSVKAYFTRNRKTDKQSQSIYDGPTSRSGPGRNQFQKSQLSSFARRGSTDSAGLIANHAQAGVSGGENSDSIIKMVSLNQQWENASSNERADRSEIL